MASAVQFGRKCSLIQVAFVFLGFSLLSAGTAAAQQFNPTQLAGLPLMIPSTVGRVTLGPGLNYPYYYVGYYPWRCYRHYVYDYGYGGGCFYP